MMEHCIYCMKEIAGNARFCPFCGKDQSAEPLQHHLKPGTVLGGRYRVGAALGEGGFGITYVGFDTALDLRVAIKEYFPYGFVTRVNTVSERVSELTDEAKAAFFKKGKTRFMQEAKVLAKFSGARGIVDVRDFFEENNTAYIVMEFVDGVTLKQRLKDHGTLSPEETLRLLTPVMESLRLLHKENVIHRDISPDNIMLTNGEVKLLDFGAARSVDGDNKSLSVMLKPGYAPEEQYRSKGKQGPWTDVYALSATMYRCITGVRPDESPDRLYDDTLKKPSEMGIDISPAFESALLKGLAVRAENRWRTVDDLLTALTKPQKQASQKAPFPPPRRPDVTRTAFTPEEFPKEKKESTQKSEYPRESISEEQNETDASYDSVDHANKDEKNKRRLKYALVGIAVGLFAMIIILALPKLLNVSTDDRDLSEEEMAATLEEAASNLSEEETTLAEEETKIAEIDYSSFETLTFGTYEQDNDTSNGAEDIEWLVLKKEGNRALVISKYALDCKPYYTDSTVGMWETCSLRAWLNHDFYITAFSESEKRKILSTTVTADANPNYSTYPGNDTTDNVFILSINEANRLFTDDESRKCTPTEYAVAQGAWMSNDNTMSDGKTSCWWWLRSPGRLTGTVAYIHYHGWIDSIGGKVSRSDVAVRPALWIELQ